MKQVKALQPGGPDVLSVVEGEIPVPGPREILVKVAGAGVNRPDVMQRMGGYPPPPGATDVLGLEISGRVVEVGSEVSRYSVGDAVMALVASGGYAEYAVVDERNALLVPATMTLEQAAAVPETFFTVWTNVFQRGGLKEGETFLVHGGTSGIGTTAIQLAKAFGANVIATAGSEEKCQQCLELGAAHTVNYKTQDFVEAVKEITGGRGVDLTIDMVGGDYLNRNMEVAANEGRIVQIAVMNGPESTINAWLLLSKKLWLTGSTLRARSIEQKQEIAEELEARVMPLWEEGRCLPVIDSIFAIDDVVDAHRRMDADHIGKIVLTFE
ncbi:NAD(P)H-quinone oxidoreductase [Halomonas meridiana]|uniref:NAD(P)H-quinone oxidoreductase n=1 Tax=Vreelandella aquamarina TaxID=77097 RepID=UPI001E61FFA1|nr:MULTISPECIES: NAD(P)H-quinone oxidoreductase [Halomonas]MCD1652103.1 NAD(P)H-quinone oxidoreductase [Halomonas axialensis]MCD2088290.1 NAD(P)H-quinone oxidoreductase [Halomonas meridiana]